MKYELCNIKYELWDMNKSVYTGPIASRIASLSTSLTNLFPMDSGEY